MVFSIYEPRIAEQALRAANEIDRLLLFPERNSSADTAAALLLSLSDYQPWRADFVNASPLSDCDLTNANRIDPSSESVLADIFLGLDESPLGLFDRMPLLIADFCTVAKGNWKDADRKQLLRIRNFFLGICREVPSVRRTSFP
jgi:hypothetical protein